MVSALRRKLAALRLAIEEGVFCLCLVAGVHSLAIGRLTKEPEKSGERARPGLDTVVPFVMPIEPYCNMYDRHILPGSRPEFCGPEPPT